MTGNEFSILLYGYGNPGRQDDGLGPVFIEKIASWIKEQNLTNVSIDSNYQLNIEDAAEISEKDIVIFIDASVEPIDRFIFTVVDPSPKVEFTMHSASPAFILDLCSKIYNKSPHTFLLHIKGYEWEMKETLTEKAEENMFAAMNFVKTKLLNPVELLNKNN